MSRAKSLSRDSRPRPQSAAFSPCRNAAHQKPATASGSSHTGKQGDCLGRVQLGLCLAVDTLPWCQASLRAEHLKCHKCTCLSQSTLTLMTCKRITPCTCCYLAMQVQGPSDLGQREAKRDSPSTVWLITDCLIHWICASLCVSMFNSQGCQISGLRRPGLDRWGSGGGQSFLLVCGDPSGGEGQCPPLQQTQPCHRKDSKGWL